jgi:hypothetical protein
MIPVKQVGTALTHVRGADFETVVLSVNPVDAELEQVCLTPGRSAMSAGPGTSSSRFSARARTAPWSAVSSSTARRRSCISSTLLNRPSAAALSFTDAEAQRS